MSPSILVNNTITVLTLRVVTYDDTTPASRALIGCPVSCVFQALGRTRNVVFFLFVSLYPVT